MFIDQSDRRPPPTGEPREDSPVQTTAGRYFFISGSPKSGTVWLTYTLNAHPEVFVTGEGVFFGRDPVSAESWIDRQAMGRWLRAQAGWVGEAEIDAVRPGLERAMVASIMESRAATSGKNPRVIGDKTTVAYAVEPARLHAAFPDARLIQIIRDGRDVATSYAFHVLRHGDFAQFKPETREYLTALAGQRLRGEPGDLPLFCHETIQFFARLWCRCVQGRTAGRALFGDRAMEIRYEDLLAEPGRVAGVFEFLGVSTHPAVVERCIAANSFEALSKGRKRGEADISSHFRKGEAGDWVNHFTPHDRKVFAQVAGAQLIELGYEPDGAWALVVPSPGVRPTVEVVDRAPAVDR